MERRIAASILWLAILQALPSAALARYEDEFQSPSAVGPETGLAIVLIVYAAALTDALGGRNWKNAGRYTAYGALVAGAWWYFPFYAGLFGAFVLLSVFIGGFLKEFCGL